MKKMSALLLFLNISVNSLSGFEKRSFQAEPNDDPSLLQYGECPQVTGFLPKLVYQQLIENCPIFCVDIFLLNMRTMRYLTIYRSNKPAQYLYFIPGGRLNKGESFFEAAVRKCREEVGITVQPQKVIGVNNLIFPDSAWGCPTHTPTVQIFATCDIDENTVSLNELHADYKWLSLYAKDPVDYNERSRRGALKILRRTKPLNLFCGRLHFYSQFLRSRFARAHAD